MEQNTLTFVLLGVLAISLAASYVRHRKGEDESSEPAVNIKQTITETRELLGLAPARERGGLADAFDLAPVQMLGDVSAPAKCRAKACSKRGGRRRKKS